MAKPVLVGRSSSVFTRVARIFAIELEVEHTFRVVPDLLAFEAERYGGNPALKLPTLLGPSGAWFGSLTICRELVRLSRRTLHLVWPEELVEPALANAQELTVQAMATEVALIMAKQEAPDASSAYQRKLRLSLENSMAWLEEHVAELRSHLPANRELSYLEVTLFCLVTHLEFREVLPVTGYRRLDEFRRAFSERPSAIATAYRYDT
ncbi:MAG TPA: glutathione S-transferase domain-containing protein [Polyangiaceae bacterium]|nr:glutathione S-transferase domain-containing protein [Polyangiaceae bacterium]